LVEQGTLNPKVEGSNPSRPIAEAPAIRAFHRAGGGSIRCDEHEGATKGQHSQSEAFVLSQIPLSQAVIRAFRPELASVGVGKECWNQARRQVLLNQAIFGLELAPTEPGLILKSRRV
jgi:hypothetical protein